MPAAAKDDSGTYGYLSYDGSWAIEPQFTRCGNFTSNGLAPALGKRSEGSRKTLGS